MNEKDRQEIDLVQLGRMYGKVNSIDDKLDASIEQTGRILQKYDKRLDDHNQRINWNKNKIVSGMGVLATVIVGWKYLC